MNCNLVESSHLSSFVSCIFNSILDIKHEISYTLVKFCSLVLGSFFQNS